jgi:hypothetical protein
VHKNNGRQWKVEQHTSNFMQLKHGLSGLRNRICDGLVPKSILELFGAFWSVSVPSSCGGVFSFGFCESLSLNFSWAAIKPSIHVFAGLNLGRSRLDNIVLVCWCVDVLMLCWWCVLMCWWLCWCVDVLMCWWHCADVLGVLMCYGAVDVDVLC